MSSSIDKRLARLREKLSQQHPTFARQHPLLVGNPKDDQIIMMVRRFGLAELEGLPWPIGMYAASIWWVTDYMTKHPDYNDNVRDGLVAALTAFRASVKDRRNLTEPEDESEKPADADTECSASSA